MNDPSTGQVFSSLFFLIFGLLMPEESKTAGFTTDSFQCFHEFHPIGHSALETLVQTFQSHQMLMEETYMSSSWNDVFSRPRLAVGNLKGSYHSCKDNTYATLRKKGPVIGSMDVIPHFFCSKAGGLLFHPQGC